MVSPSTAFRIIASERRRHALRYFTRRSTDAATVDELAAFVDERVDERDRRRIEIELVHEHLPALVTAGLIEYDERNRRVQYAGNALIEQCLELVSSHDLD
ncbi:hypothetical protein EA472_21765 [Natrarchaeobius oligotrophus]|uniref:DUF7344 domain-containing protein n=1 Tax=Natrarchaeobius chitinivorans TaxID=1679083 RepID=A0A3N6MI47_NATCH|nr:hypothetical protein EA472_21765 [Natrarchaeobius chitinivorans]